MRRVMASVAAIMAAVTLPVAFSLWPEPVFATATEGSSALADLEEFFSPTTSLQSIPGGAGAGLGTAGELSGGAVDISGELAGVAADGAISLTPVGWAIAASLAAGAGGYYAWKNRGAILGAVKSVWNDLSSSQQSTLESGNTAGSTVSIPSGAIQSVLGSLTDPFSGVKGAATGLDSLSSWSSFTVPAAWPQGDALAIDFVLPSYVVGNNVVGVAIPAVSGVAYSWAQTGGSQNGGAQELGTSYYGILDFVGSISDQMTIHGLTAGQTFFVQGTYSESGNTFSSSGLLQPSAGVLDTGAISFSLAAVPNASSAAVPPSEVVPTPTSSTPTFWPGTYNPTTTQVEPIGTPAPNPVVEPVASTLPVGTPAPGFVQWVEDLVVPTANQLEGALAPLQDAFADRIPFSYVEGTLQLLPEWADGLGSGGCADFPIPSFGFENPVHPGQGGSQYEAAVCPGGFMSNAFSLLKSAETVLMWAFLLGWGVFMFSSLMRNG